MRSCAGIRTWCSLALLLPGVVLAGDARYTHLVRREAQRRTQPGYKFTRQQIPAELVVNRSGIRYTSPAMTALDLCGAMGGDAIDQALRARVTTLGQLYRAMELTAARKGNRTKRQLLLDSRAEPWSKAERLFHRLLRNAGITGWRANRPVVLDDSTFYVDVIFRKLKLVIEIDGRLYHTGAEVFESDRLAAEPPGPERLVRAAVHLDHDRGAS